MVIVNAGASLASLLLAASAAAASAEYPPFRAEIAGMEVIAPDAVRMCIVSRSEAAEGELARPHGTHVVAPIGKRFSVTYGLFRQSEIRYTGRVERAAGVEGGDEFSASLASDSDVTFAWNATWPADQLPSRFEACASTRP